MSTEWTIHDPPRQVVLVEPRLGVAQFGAGSLILGLIISAGSAYLALAGSGVIEFHARMNVPPAVIAAIGYAFLLAGLKLVFQGLASLRNRARQRRLKRGYPDRHWLADYPWDAEGISDRPHAIWW